MLVSETKCIICNNVFVKPAWNSKTCSNDCRALKDKKAKSIWHDNHKAEENTKSRIRVAKYTNYERKNIYKVHRIRNCLSMLESTSCSICSTLFKQSCHNSKTCSQACSSKLSSKRNNEYIAYRLKHDINFRLAHSLRNRLYKAIKLNKSGSAVRDLGCSIKEFKKHLELRFQKGMNWNNYGKWHIDHIVPLSSFNLENREELLKACNYTNLQPLWAKDNLKKGSITRPII